MFIGYVAGFWVLPKLLLLTTIDTFIA
jgi:hypothetical protein